MDKRRFQFRAPEIDRQGNFTPVLMEFLGNEESGWSVIREGNEILQTGPGYSPLAVDSCGICSTDPARPHLPYPLPQIIGHEVVVRNREGQTFVAEINASHLARGLTTDCPFCSQGLHTHCPERITMGINLLPGGFAPLVLVPTNALVPVPRSVSEKMAGLTEPFAAALHAVDSHPPASGERVAVVGPGRLGNLLIAALHARRLLSKNDFHITAIGRREALAERSLASGADTYLNGTSDPVDEEAGNFDLVYDTSGSLAGFELAIQLSRHLVHLKSTTGMPVAGMKQMSDMVVDEISLLPPIPQSATFHWPNETLTNRPAILVHPNISQETEDRLLRGYPGEPVVFRLDPVEAARRIKGDPSFLSGFRLPRFDLALMENENQADAVIRPFPGEEFSILRPRGGIILTTPSDPLMQKALLKKSLQIRTSRCGDFHRALELAESCTDHLNHVAELMTGQSFPLSRITAAFQYARGEGSGSKIIVTPDEKPLDPFENS